MANDHEKNKKTDPKRDVEEKSKLTDQELAEELSADNIEADEQDREAIDARRENSNNLFTPTEIGEELADELVVDDIDSDADLSEGDIGLPETDTEDLFPTENDEEIAQELADLVVDEKEEDE